MEHRMTGKHESVIDKTTCGNCGGSGRQIVEWRDKHGKRFEVDQRCLLCGGSGYSSYSWMLKRKDDDND